MLVVMHEKADRGTALQRCELRVGVNGGTATLTRPRRTLLRKVFSPEPTTRAAACAHLRELLAG